MLLLFVAVTGVTSLPLAGTGFLADDLQILTLAVQGTPLSEYAQPAVWSHYWRPIAVSVFKLCHAVNGLDALWFRLAGILLYSGVCFLFYRLLLTLGIAQMPSLLAALLFSLLPSHELNLAWISDQSELLAGGCILGALLAFAAAAKKKPRALIAYFACVLGALLSKEIAITIFLLPIAARIMLPAMPPWRQTLMYSAATLALTIGVYAYRLLVIGHLPLGSGHLQGATAAGSAANYFFYLPFAVITPDIAEQLYAAVGALLGVVLLAAAAAIAAAMAWRYGTRAGLKWRQAAGGLLLYSAVIIPVLPVFMRWYVFIPSLGLAAAAALLAEPLLLRRAGRYAAAVLLLLLAVYRVGVFTNWQRAGSALEILGATLRRELAAGSASEVVLFGMPDKIARVSVCKLGISETVSYFAGKQLSVEAPLRVELVSAGGGVTGGFTNDSTFTLTTANGRFLRAGGKSRAVICNEHDSLLWRGIRIQIVTSPAESRATLVFTPAAPALPTYYYNGTGIVPIVPGRENIAAMGRTVSGN